MLFILFPFKFVISRKLRSCLNYMLIELVSDVNKNKYLCHNYATTSLINPLTLYFRFTRNNSINYVKDYFIEDVG